MADTVSTSIRLSADASQVKAEMASAGDAVDKAATRIEQRFQRLAGALDPAIKASNELAAGQKVLNDAVARGVVDGAEYERLMGLLKDRHNSVTTAVNETTRALGASHGSISTATREFRALFDELSSGRTRQTPGTLAIIANRVLGIGGAALGATAGVAGFFGVLIKAATDAEAVVNRVKVAIATTGNFAGVTPGSVLGLASQLDANSALSYRGAEDALTALIGTGRIRGSVLPGAASLVPDIAAAQGVDQTQAAKFLADVLQDPAKGAKQLAETFNLLDVTTRRHVEELAAEGHADEAQQILVDALTGRFKGLAEQTESLGGVFQRIGKIASDAWSWLGESVLGPQTPGQSYAAAQRVVRQARGENTLTAQIARGQASVAGYQEYQESRVAADDAQIAADRALVRQAVDASARTPGLAEQIDLMNRALAAAQRRGEGSEVTGEIQHRLDVLHASSERDPIDEQIRRLNEETAVLRAAPRDRARLSGRYAIEDQYRANTTLGSDSADRAGEIRAAAEQKLAAQLAKPTDDAIAKLDEETQASKALAEAWTQGAAAASRMKLVQEALAQSASGAINDETRYTAALERRAQAAAQAASAQVISTAGTANQDLAAIVAAGGDPAAVLAARRAAEARHSLAGEANTVTDAASAGLYQQHLQQLEKELQLRDQLDQQARSSDEDNALRRQAQELETQLSLMGDTATVRAKEIADLRTRNELIQQGYQEGTQAYQDELAKRTALNEKIEETQAKIVQANDANKQWQKDTSFIVNEAGGLFDKLGQAADGSANKWRDFQQALHQALFMLTVANPVKNLLNGLLPGAGTTQAPTLMSLFQQRQPPASTGVVGAGAGALTSSAGGGLFGNLGGGGDWYSQLFGGGASGAGNTAGVQGPGAGFYDSPGLLSGAGNWISSFFAKGGVFDRGLRIKMHAIGDIFSRPTAFAMAGGGGLDILGEAGPEAAMPLTRTSSGHLGVRAVGGGSVTHNHYNDFRGADSSLTVQVKGLQRMVQEINASIESRAVTAMSAASLSGAHFQGRQRSL